MGVQDGTERGAPPFAWLHRVDDAVYQVERTIVVSFLISIAVTMFLDVVHGRLVAQDSKIGKILAKLGGVHDTATRAWIDHDLAPWVGLGLGIGLVWFGFWTAERHKKAPLLPVPHAPVVATVLAVAGIAAACWLMQVLESWQFYMLLYAAAMGFYVRYLLRVRPPRWKLRAGVIVVGVTPAFYLLVHRWIPRGFTWSQELSLMMLLWIGFLGASVCAHEGKHLRMEAFDRVLPPKLSGWIQAAGFLSAAAFCTFLALLGYLYVTGPAAATQSAQMGIPDRLSIVSVPIAFAVTALRFLAAAGSAAIGGMYGRPLREVEVGAAPDAAAGTSPEEPA